MSNFECDRCKVNLNPNPDTERMSYGRNYVSFSILRVGYFTLCLQCADELDIILEKWLKERKNGTMRTM